CMSVSRNRYLHQISALQQLSKMLLLCRRRALHRNPVVGFSPYAKGRLHSEVGARRIGVSSTRALRMSQVATETSSNATSANAMASHFLVRRDAIGERMREA